MKKSESHLRLTWRFNLALSVPIESGRAATIVRHVLLAACLVTLALGFVPLLALLAGT